MVFTGVKLPPLKAGSVAVPYPHLLAKLRKHRTQYLDIVSGNYTTDSEELYTSLVLQTPSLWERIEETPLMGSLAPLDLGKTKGAS